jgi:phage protein D
MSPVVSRRSLGLADDYYAPEFEVEIEGTPLDATLKGDVREVKVVLDLDDLASAELTLSNYDEGAYEREEASIRQLSAVGAAGPPRLTSALRYSDVFRLHSRVHVKLGYAGKLVSILRGEIQTLSADFPSADAPTLTVRALDALAALKDKFPGTGEDQYKDKKDWQIVQAVAFRNDLAFEIAKDDMDGPVHALVVQECQDDLRFVKDRARQLGFDVSARLDEDTGKTVVRFAKPRDGRGPEPLQTYVLAWGSLHGAGGDGVPPSLISFKPTITTTSLVESVTVRGWDADSKKPITATAKLGAKVPGKEPEAKIEASKKNVIVTDLAIEHVEQARARAQALLDDRLKAYFTASAKTLGLPDMRPADNVEIYGVGARFNGRYLVTKVSHTLNGSGFTTDFDVRKATEDGT